MTPTNVSSLTLVLYLSFHLQAFGDSVDAPPELLELAKQSRDLGVCSDFPCKDYSAYCYETVTLSAADKANGVQDKAYLGVAFIYQHPAGEWFDKSYRLTLTKKAGTWTVVHSKEPMCRDRCTC